MKFDKIVWEKAFFKTYYERRSFLHLLVNFNRIWVLHISMFWFYTAYNSPTMYTPAGASRPNPAMQWSAVALGGAVASLIMLAATLAEWSYVPTTWNNASHLMRRFVVLLFVLAATAGPTIYIAFFDQTSAVARILGYVQFGVSVAVVAFFSIVPSGRLLGDRVAGKSRKYLASQTFTASYPALVTRARLASLGLWFLVFGCKLTESYFFLTLSFVNPIRVMVGMRVQGCSDKIFGNALCQHQPAFALTIMFCMDLCLFFLDTFLWYVIWNTGESSSESVPSTLADLVPAVFSIARSFAIGLSIWTPWKGAFIPPTLQHS
jgi:1,3-beta-glucan synthase